MELKYHEDRCLDKFGNKFTHVHLFLDRYFKKYGPSHRALLHHKVGVNVVVSHFGEAARGPAELHIRDDTRGKLPDDWAYYGDPFFLNLALYGNFDRELKKLYKLI